MAESQNGAPLDGGVAVSPAPVGERDRLAMRPPYRRGAAYIRCGLRLSMSLWRELQLEGRRRRRWVSDLAEQLLTEGLERHQGRPRAVDPPPLAVPEPAADRHWVRLAIERPIWEVLRIEADRRRLSVAQLIRQMVGDAARAMEEPTDTGSGLRPAA